MATHYKNCPKCGHELPATLPAEAACPACGLYTFKWQQEPSASSLYPDEALNDEPGFSLLTPLSDIDAQSYYGRWISLSLLALWSVPLFLSDYRDGEIGMSFMHNILLPIHEAGHMLFIPLGEFMTILGGSLFQLLLPFGIAVAFILKNRDNFGGALGLWWTSVSLVDLSPYIYDALHPQLILLGGHTGEDGPHDWIYLLGRLGQLQHAQEWGAFAHSLGGLMMLAALSWAGLILLRQTHHKN